MSERRATCATTLTQRVLNFFGQGTVEDVLHDLTARVRPVRDMPRIDGLARILLDEAEAGDQVARNLVYQHGRALGDYALVAARHVELERTAFPLVLAGGVLRHPSLLLANAIIERVRESSPAVQVVRSHLEPVIGVLFTSLSLARVHVDAAVRARVENTLPEAALFDTSPVCSGAQERCSELPGAS